MRRCARNGDLSVHCETSKDKKVKISKGPACDFKMEYVHFDVCLH